MEICICHNAGCNFDWNIKKWWFNGMKAATQLQNRRIHKNYETKAFPKPKKSQQTKRWICYNAGCKLNPWKYKKRITCQIKIWYEDYRPILLICFSRVSLQVLQYTQTHTCACVDRTAHTMHRGKQKWKWQANAYILEESRRGTDCLLFI